MKYTYAYKTSDGVRHEDSLDAGSRDEAFAVLRGRGIRPIKVVAADGSKENGEWGIGNGERGRRSGWVVGAVAVLFVAFALFAVFVSKWGNGERGTEEEKWMGCGRCRRPICGLCALCVLCV